MNTAAKRRYNELRKKTHNLSFNEVKRALYKRNLSDKTRSISPLQKHTSAIVINSAKYDKLSMVAKMSKYVEKFLIKKYGIRTRN